VPVVNNFMFSAYPCGVVVTLEAGNSDA